MSTIENAIQKNNPDYTQYNFGWMKTHILQINKWVHKPYMGSITSYIKQTNSQKYCHYILSMATIWHLGFFFLNTSPFVGLVDPTRIWFLLPVDSEYIWFNQSRSLWPDILNIFHKEFNIRLAYGSSHLEFPFYSYQNTL